MQKIYFFYLKKLRLSKKNITSLEILIINQKVIYFHVKINCNHN